MMRIVAVANQKGGVGKSTVVMNIAAIAAETSRVMVVDVDPQRSASTWATRAGEGLPFDFAEEHDPSVLSRLRELDRYDVIFVDTPGSLRDGDVLGAALDAADFVILPLEAQPLSVEPLVTTIKNFVAPRRLSFRALISRYNAQRGGDVRRQHAEELLDQSDIPRFNTAIRDYVVHSDAPLTGSVVTQYPSNRQTMKAVDDFRKVTFELMSFWANGGK